MDLDLPLVVECSPVNFKSRQGCSLKNHSVIHLQSVGQTPSHTTRQDLKEAKEKKRLTQNPPYQLMLRSRSSLHTQKNKEGCNRISSSTILQTNQTKLEISRRASYQSYIPATIATPLLKNFKKSKGTKRDVTRNGQESPKRT